MNAHSTPRLYCRNFATRKCAKFLYEDHTRSYCYECRYSDLIEDVVCGSRKYLFYLNGLPTCAKNGNGCGDKVIRSTPCLKHDWKKESWE